MLESLYIKDPDNPSEPLRTKNNVSIALEYSASFMDDISVDDLIDYLNTKWIHRFD